MNYYNEFDRHAAAWTRQLIADGLIPNGIVDERSIVEVQPSDLRGFTQCHFFNGISGWSLALKRAGIPDDTECWLGSCPCQSFSVAGKQLGAKDDRHLWPHFFRLIKACRPPLIFGEQVANAISHGWMDGRGDRARGGEPGVVGQDRGQDEGDDGKPSIVGVQTNLEAENYAVGSIVLGAHSAGAPHIRQRLYWFAHRRSVGGLANAQHSVGRPECEIDGDPHGRHGPGWGGDAHRMDSSIRAGLQGHAGDGDDGRESRRIDQGTTGSTPAPSRPSWSEFDIVVCRDGKARRIPRQTPSALAKIWNVVDGLPAGVGDGWQEGYGWPLSTDREARIPLLKGAGNAIVPELAAMFVTACMESI